ncbi:hypothetical protein ACWEGX_36800 [Streptomyces chartreusis]|uniref:hypothetical protein n=1 Tax=Streptomyces griseomycini TaxID=66895 RepID=UPI0034135BF1
MTVPGGSRREKWNGVLGGDPQGAEPSLDSSYEFADMAGKGEVRRNGKRGGGLVHGGEESERDAPSGVWLSAEDGTVLFHPVSAGTEGLQRWSAPEAGSVEEADEMTLDAASRLMPLLPRELIAEYLQLGPFRDGGDAS